MILAFANRCRQPGVLLPESGDAGMDSVREIEAFVHAFEDCSLARPLWTHTAHLKAALWLLRHLPRAEATERIRDGIRSYNAFHRYCICTGCCMTLARSASPTSCCASRAS